MRDLLLLATAIAGLVFSTGSNAQAYSNAILTKVGYVQVSGQAGGGPVVWKQKGGGNFPACTSDPWAMWIGTSDSITEAAAKSMLALLLTAKVVDAEVWVYYRVDERGYCRMQHLGIN